MTLANRKKTLLFVSHSPYFYGAERVLYFLVEDLKSDYDVHVAIPGSGMLGDRMARLPGVSIHTIDLPVFTKSPAAIMGALHTFVRYFIRLRSLLRSIKPDLVYGNTIRNYITCLYAQILGYPCVLHLHEKNVGMPAGRFLAGIINRYAERVIYVSAFVRRSYECLSATLCKKGMTIYNGVYGGADDVIPDLRGMIIPEGSFPVLASAANLEPHKRLDDLIEAMGMIVKDYPHALLLIAGEGTYSRQLAGHIRRKGLGNNIVLTGYLHGIGALLDAADIVLCPFEEEGFGLVALEAMAHKKPVVAADSGALTEIVEEGMTGLLYRTGDIPVLVEKIRRLAQSPEICSQLGQQGYIRSTRKFAASLQAEQVREVIKEVCSHGAERMEGA